MKLPPLPSPKFFPRTSLWRPFFLAALAFLWTIPALAQGLDDEALRRLLTEAAQALESGDLDTAENRFTQLASAEPNSALPWVGLAQISERRGALNEALARARTAQEKAPGEVEAVFYTSRLLVMLGAAGEALDTLTTARELAPKDSRGYLLAALILRQVDQLDQAIALLEEGAAKVEDDPEVPGQLGLLLLSSGQPERALEITDKTLEAYPENSVLTLVRGLALAAVPERRSEALGWLETALRRGAPDPGRIHLEIATLLLESDRKSEALDHLSEAQKLLPESPEMLYRLGNALRTAGDLEGANAALAQFQELSRAQDEGERRRKELGTALNEAQRLAAENKLPEALERLEALAADHPQNDGISALQAKVLFSMGRKEDALDRLGKAQELAPDDAEYPYLEGYFLYTLDRPFQAAAAFQRALAIDPGLGEAHAVLGALHLDWDDAPMAIEHFQKALARGTDSADLRLAYAKALGNVGRRAEQAAQMEAWRRLAEP